jgi:hypothetical protein
MRVLKQSKKAKPRLSLILLDWGVRESFHLLHYLKNQTLPKETFEVVLIEYYDSVSKPAEQFASEIDSWILLEMPPSCYYHKHLMYNVGIVVGRGELLAFADSDAMVRPTFIETILKAFDRDPLMVYHMDEFRNIRRDFYPFTYPSFEDVLGDGSINNVGGKTKGILDQTDPMHSRNYGACMCAVRNDLLTIGGADEDLTYLGHICGPYDMTFRLMNAGRRMVWEPDEYLYHTWHPGSDGIANYLGPHDGKNMSTTAFQALCSGRIPPLVENQAIRCLRTATEGDLLDMVIDPRYAEMFNRAKLGGPVNSTVTAPHVPKNLIGSHSGFDVYAINGSYYGVPQHMGTIDPEAEKWSKDRRIIRGHSFGEIREVLENYDTHLVQTIGLCNICSVGKRFAVVPHEIGAVDFRDPFSRDDSHVIWAETLDAARRIATDLVPAPQPSELERSSSETVPAPVASVGVMPATRVDVQTEITQLRWAIAALEQRLTAGEEGLVAIHQSRTWQWLITIGGFLESAGKVLGFGR